MQHIDVGLRLNRNFPLSSILRAQVIINFSLNSGETSNRTWSRNPWLFSEAPPVVIRNYSDEKPRAPTPD